MTDGQFNILIATIGAGLAGLAAVIRWSVKTLTRSLDKNTAAHLESVKAMTEMSTKLDFVYNQTGKVADFVKEELSGTHEPYDPDITPTAKPKRPEGRYHKRRARSEPQASNDNDDGDDK